MAQINPSRRLFLHGIGASLLVTYPLLNWAKADDWPSSSVNFIVPFAPGGPVDTAARIVGKEVTEALNIAAIIDNKAGAGGIVGARLAAKAKADGNHMFFSAIHHAILPSINNELGYDIEKNFKAVAGIARFPIILIAHPSLGINSVTELIKLAKEKPLEISYSSSGVGGGTHLAGELFANQAEIELQHIPYKGSAPAVQDLVGGRVQLMFADATSALPFIESKKVIPLGVGNPERTKLAPDVPTINEAGLEGYEAYSWSGLHAPKDTPDEIIEKLSQVLIDVLSKDSVAKRMESTGSEPLILGPQEFEKFVHQEIKKWHQTIKEADITI